MATDMSLGGGSFGAGYTPIRFAPLVSLTGPVMAPATPAAPEAVAPMAPALRLPQMSDMPDNAYMTGEAQQGTPGAGFVNPLAGMNGSQIAQAGLNALSFFTNSLGFAAQYALTGKTPAQNFQGLFSGGFQGLLGGGPQQESVSLGGSSAGGLASQGLGMGSAVFSDAMNAALASGASEEAAAQAGRTALGLFSQGMDPAAAVALGSVTQISRNPFDMTSGQGIPSTPAGMPGLSRNPFDLTAPVAPQAAQTFALGQPNESSYSPSDFTGGGWSAGDVAGAYSDSTGFE